VAGSSGVTTGVGGDGGATGVATGGGTAAAAGFGGGSSMDAGGAGGGSPAEGGPRGDLDGGFTGGTVTEDIQYAQVTDEYGLHTLFLDTYAPTGDMETDRPAVVWIHGGNFKTGDKKQLAFFAKKYARRGYVSVPIEYRLLKAYAFPV